MKGKTLMILYSDFREGLFLNKVKYGDDGKITEYKSKFLDLAEIVKEISSLHSDGENHIICQSPEYLFIPLSDYKLPAIWTDWNLNPSLVLENLKKFSVVFIDGAGAERLKNLPVKIIELPIYAMFVRCPGNVVNGLCSDFMRRKDIDVVFLGSMNPGIHSRRNRILKKILTLPEKYRIVVGNGLYDGDLYYALLSRARIVFNFSIRWEMNMRVFESARTCSLIFLEDENLETWKYIRKWEDAIPYTYDEIDELIRKYADDEKSREKIAISGAEKLSRLTRESILNKIINTISGIERDRIVSIKSDVDEFMRLRVATFRSAVNCVYNCSMIRIDHNFLYLENSALEIFKDIDLYTQEPQRSEFKASLLNDLAFIYFFSIVRMSDEKKKGVYVDKAQKYLMSALSIQPTSSLYWYNLIFTYHSLRRKDDFLFSVRKFFELINSADHGLNNVRGLPSPFCPLPFMHYNYLKTYIDKVWIDNFSDTDLIRRNMGRALLGQVYIFVSNFFIEENILDHAENYCLKALSLFPELSDIYFLLGKIKFLKKEFSESARAYIKGYELDPIFFGKWPEIISALASAGMKDELQKIQEEMKIMAKRMYVFNGFELEAFGQKIRVKSIEELVMEHIIGK